MLNHPVDASDDVEHAASASATKHTDRHDLCSLGNTIGLPCNGAGHMGAVAIAVFATSPIIDARGSCYNAPAKIAMVATHASVDDVGVDTCTCVVVGIILVESS